MKITVAILPIFFFTSAVAQTVDLEEVKDLTDANIIQRFIAKTDINTGKVVLIPEDGSDFDQSQFGNYLYDTSKITFETKPEAGFAYFDQKGDLVEVFSAPRTKLDQDYLWGRIENGGSISKVGFFSNAPSLPTMDQARSITEESINAALSVICNSDPRPEDMKLEVSLATTLGLQGKFAITMGWKPARDCNN